MAWFLFEKLQLHPCVSSDGQELRKYDKPMCVNTVLPNLPWDTRLVCVSIPRSENRSSGPFGKKLQTENWSSGTSARPIPAAGKRRIRRLLLRECISYRIYQNCIKIAFVPRNPIFHLLTFLCRPLCMHIHEAKIFVYLWKTILYHFPRRGKMWAPKI